MNNVRKIKKILSVNQNEIYFDSFSRAVQHAKQSVEDRGYTLNESDWNSRITFGNGKPSEGKTFRCSIRLLTPKFKNTKKELHIQIYNRGNDVPKRFELNFYIS
jgi:hypothetical protein